MNIRIRDYAQSVKSDIDPDLAPDAAAPDHCVNGCALRATEALKRAASGLTDLDRINVSVIFDGMRISHQSIQILLSSGSKPTSVDALALARLQLESLYAICLMVEDPKWISVYIKDGWKKMYKLFLCQRQEYGDLPRAREKLEREFLPAIRNLQELCGVKEEEKATIEVEELEIPVPSGKGVSITSFPTPGRIIKKIHDADRRKMLMRLYAEYDQLSSYVHGLPSSEMLRRILGDHHDSSTGEREIIFDERVAGPALHYSCLSVAQASSELTCLYPNDVELRARVTDAWNLLTKHSLLGKTIWEIRTRKLLGSI